MQVKQNKSLKRNQYILHPINYETSGWAQLGKYTVNTKRNNVLRGGLSAHMNTYTVIAQKNVFTSDFSLILL